MSDFWNKVAGEVERFVAGEKSATDFTGRFYALVDQMPIGNQGSLRERFERFHEVVADFEPNAERRRREQGLIDEEQLRSHAQRFLTDLRQLKS